MITTVDSDIKNWKGGKDEAVEYLDPLYGLCGGRANRLCRHFE